MSLSLFNLDSKTRQYMLSEYEYDVKKHNHVYIGENLDSLGRRFYPDFLKEAIEKHDESWLAMKIENMFNPTETRQLKGKTITVEVRKDAHIVLAESEFNRLYMRALCLRAIDEKIHSLIIYSAKHTQSSRSQSLALIRQKFINPETLLNDLRNSFGTETTIGIGEVGSSLSVRLS